MLLHSAGGGRTSTNPNAFGSSSARTVNLAPICTGSMLSFFKAGKKRSQGYLAGAAAPGSPNVELADYPSTSSPNTTSRATADIYTRSTAFTPGKVLSLRSAVCYLPHPDKVHYGGEDAHFISNYGGGAVGVSDGVGGWQESGVNPADYSRGLMSVACAFLEGRGIFEEQAKSRNGVLIDPRAALDAAHQHTKVPGSATICVMQLDQKNRWLTAANLGDSGFLVIRDGKELIKSKPLQHYFDCPLQFGAFPEYVEATDTAEMADLYNIALRPYDIIVAGSDGLWDNCYVSEIISLSPKSPDRVQGAADAIAATARRHAADHTFVSPYAREALAQGLDLPWWDKLMGMTFKNGKFQLRQLTGGKMDDITVLVSMVEEVEPPSPPSPPSAEPPAGKAKVAELPGGDGAADSDAPEDASGSTNGTTAPAPTAAAEAAPMAAAQA